MLPNQLQFSLRCGLSQKVVDPSFRCNRGSCKRIVAGNHDCGYPHLPEFSKPLLNASLYDIAQTDNAEHLIALGNYQRSCACASNFLDDRFDISWEVSALVLNVIFYRIRGALSYLATVHIYAAHTRVGREGDKLRTERMNVPFTKSVFLLCQYHDAATFRSFVRQG